MAPVKTICVWICILNLIIPASSNRRKCPALYPVALNDTSFAGKWFMIQKSHNDDAKLCQTVEFKFTREGSRQTGTTIEINSTYYDGRGYRSAISEVHKKQSFLRGFILKKSEQSMQIVDKASVSNFFVLHLDNKFSVCYFCMNVYNIIREKLWLLSRLRTPDTADVEQIVAKVEQLGIKAKLELADQSDCEAPNTTVTSTVNPLKSSGLAGNEGSESSYTGCQSNRLLCYLSCLRQGTYRGYVHITSCLLYASGYYPFEPIVQKTSN